jgi:tetratricopeptide (TPR) repeat protein
MLSAVILAASLGALSDDALSTSSKPDLAAYNEAVAKTGKSADAQVRLALWCEAHGMSAERLKHLAMAVLYEPSNVLARGLMGLVAHEGKWERPEQVSQAIQNDPARQARINEYLKRRAESKDRADDHWKLAVWCEQNGLKEQADAHLREVLRLDPKRESAWKRMGFKRVGGRWIKPAEAAAAKAEALHQKKANEHWRPILERLRAGLQSKDGARRAEAEKALAQVTDRLAAPMVWATFARGNAPLQKVAVQVFGQIDDPTASRSLVMLAVFGGSGDVRRLATETLRRRDAREFAGLLIAMIQRPIKYTVKKVGGPGQPGELLIKGQGSTPNLKRVYSPPPAPSIPLQPGDQVVMDANGLPVVNRPEYAAQLPFFSPYQLFQPDHFRMPTSQQSERFMSMLGGSGLGALGQKLGRQVLNLYDQNIMMMDRSGDLAFAQSPFRQAVAAMIPDNGQPIGPNTAISPTIAQGESIPVGRMAVEAQKTAAMAQQQLQNDVNSIDQYNSSLSEINNRVVPILENVSGQNLGPDSGAWQGWLNNLVGFNSLQASAPPTITQDVPLAYQPEPIPLGTFTGVIGVQRMSCFGAGTMVRTLTGSEPIEKLKLGDQVLTQSTKSGALAYKPILAVHHNPPSKTYEIKLGAETIVSSYFHRFWKAGSGWAMARDLNVGDSIRTLSGTVKIKAIEDGRVVPVFNLDVADDADFFVGDMGVLAHDNTLPNLRETPFDALMVPGQSAKASRD